MKSATAICKGGKIYLQGYSETTVGIWVSTGPVFVSDASDSEGARTSILSALEHSSRGVPHPLQSEWKGVQAPMLNAVGARSWKGLAKDAFAVGIEEVEGTITFTPGADYEDYGGRDLPELAVTSNLSDDNLGDALLRAFEACR
ncbi:MAG: hypothetical protein KA104_00725 [Candidatus Pacebacteria bacterium]|nr:hypothetical protein [Candidatus Paceibacterota bacterium]